MDRSYAEAALCESEERQAFLLKFSAALRAPSDASANIDVAVEMLAAELGCDRAFIVVVAIPFWMLVTSSTTPRRWSESEIHWVEDVTERTWAAVERARAEAALRESEENSEPRSRGSTRASAFRKQSSTPTDG